jgi:hypothetical protein
VNVYELDSFGSEQGLVAGPMKRWWTSGIHKMIEFLQYLNFNTKLFSLYWCNSPSSEHNLWINIAQILKTNWTKKNSWYLHFSTTTKLFPQKLEGHLYKGEDIGIHTSLHHIQSDANSHYVQLYASYALEFTYMLSCTHVEFLNMTYLFLRSVFDVW